MQINLYLLTLNVYRYDSEFVWYVFCSHKLNFEEGLPVILKLGFSYSRINYLRQALIVMFLIFFFAVINCILKKDCL